MTQAIQFHRCFLSYNSKDKKFVAKLGKDLLRNGIDVWFDEWEIQAGDSITGKISEGLKISNIFLIVMSTNSMKSNWVKEELRTALYRRVNDQNFRIIPLLHKKCAIQELSMLLHDLSFIDFRYTKKYLFNFQNLLDSIRQSTNKPPLKLDDIEFSEVLKDVPINYLKKNAMYYQSLASEFIQAGEYSKAVPFLKKAVAFDPEHSSAYFDLAHIHVRMGRYKQALSFYEKVVELDPRNSSAWFDLGFVNVRLGNYEKAKKSYQRVVELDPSHSTAFHDLGLISHRLLHYEDALKYYQKHLHFEPQNFLVKLICANILFKQRRFDDAEKYAKEILEYNPSESEAQEILAKINSER
jgi:tetratricopeptide (TPR) repeat protein